MKYFIDNIEVSKNQFELAKKSGRYNINEQNLTLMTNYKIQELKDQLAATDYQAIKHSEGLISDKDYNPIKAQRQAWRDEINQLEQNV